MPANRQVKPNTLEHFKDFKQCLFKHSDTKNCVCHWGPLLILEKQTREFLKGLSHTLKSIFGQINTIFSRGKPYSNRTKLCLEQKCVFELCLEKRACEV